MSYTGFWKFHSMGVMTDEGLVYMGPEEYLKSPMPYIDETDEEAVADEMKERKMSIGTRIEVCEDGKLYILAPLPEGVTQEEVDEAVKAGQVELRHGAISAGAMAWEERDGKLWFDSGIEGEVFGEKADPWVSASEDEGYLSIITTRYVKED